MPGGPGAAGAGGGGGAGRDAESLRRFVLDHTAEACAPLVPELPLRLATEITPIWLATEAWLDERNVDPPYWAFAWPGGQALARLLLDRPSLAAGLRVLDFAAGGGIAALAAARAGAALVEAAEIDPLALAAVAVNAERNGLRVDAAGDVLGAPCRWDLILCGDVCYEAPMTARILPWLRLMARAATVLVADPGRAYLPRDGIAELACYDVPTSLELEDRTMRPTRVFRLLP